MNRLTLQKNWLGVLLLGMIILGVVLTTHPVQAQTPAFCDTVTEVSKDTCAALVALYNSTHGENWTNHTGWLTTNTPCSWYGIRCAGVMEINLSNNNLVGTLPAALGKLRIFQLDLSHNQLSGPIPPELGDLQSDGGVGMSLLILSHNQLSGPIPPELGDLSAFSVLDLSHNQLSGPIPATLSNLDGQGMFPHLYVYLSHNQLSGPIPATLGQMASQAIFGIGLDFSNNQITGTLPSGLLRANSFAGINALDVSNNPLTGPLPADALESAISVLYFDNTGICEPEERAMQFWLRSLRDLRTTNQTCICDNPQLTGLTAAECDGLVDLFNYTGGTTWTAHNNWLATLDPCHWDGVTCTDGAVTALELGNNGLVGHLLESLGNLTKLTKLHLQNNNLDNALPAGLVRLKQLTELRFDDTRLCEPETADMQQWLAGLPTVQRTNLICHLLYFPFMQR